MKVPESWLRTFCNPPMAGKEVAERLTMAGIEVETCEPVGPQLSGVVVGEVLSVERHPNADKLTICKVDSGSETLQVVCGAPNVRKGMKAPLARPGITTLRGVESRFARRASSASQTIIPACWNCRKKQRPAAMCARRSAWTTRC
jgi:hypothetical protein